MCSAKDVDFW